MLNGAFCTANFGGIDDLKPLRGTRTELLLLPDEATLTHADAEAMATWTRVITPPIHATTSGRG